MAKLSVSTSKRGRQNNIIMWLLSRLLAFFGSWTHPRLKAVEPIDFTDKFQVRKIAELGADLGEDMYCHTIDEPSCGHAFFKFINHPRYKGKVVKQYRASVKLRLPKILVWDWDGDKEGSGVPPTRFIAMRGTHSEEEWTGNFHCLEVPSETIGIDPPIKGVFHQDFANVSWTIWENLQNHIKDSPYPVIITGHSRGGALAQMLHVIAKRNLPNNNIYAVTFAAPPSMALDPGQEYLTKDIYGFVYRNDPIPRFFIDQVVDVFCKGKPVLCSLASGVAGALAKRCEELGLDVCDDQYKTTITTFIGAIFANLVKGLKRTYAIHGIKNRANLLGTLFKQYREDPTRFRIRRHVGQMYSLDSWVKESKSSDWDKLTGCTREQIEPSKFHSPEELRELTQISFWGVLKGLKDHDARSYRHAIQDPACDILPESMMLLDDSARAVAENPFYRDYRLVARASEPLPDIPDINYPSWLPEFDDDDDFVVCDLDAINESESQWTVTDFQWTSVNESWQCDGVSLNCNMSYILSAVCSNDTMICAFNATEGTDECAPLPSKEVVFSDRCGVDKAGDCYKESISQDKSSSGCSSNRNPTSSVKKSHAGSSAGSNDSNSRSSREGISSSPSSVHEYCNDQYSCADDLGDFVVTRVYLGGNPCLDFEPGYQMMRVARQLFGQRVPAPNFQHTAIWFGERDDGDDSIGAILVYGEYYNYNQDPTYLSCDGARSFVMTLGEFKQMFRSFPVKKMRPGRNLTLTQLLSEVKNSGDWSVDDYNWITNNCQHFTAAVLNVLEAKRNHAQESDWAEIPPPIMNTILRLELTY